MKNSWDFPWFSEKFQQFLMRNPKWAAVVHSSRRDIGGSAQDTADKEPQHSSFLVSSLTTWKRQSGFSSPHITKITIFLVSIYIIYTKEDFFYKILKPGTAGISEKPQEKAIPWVGQTSRPAAVRSLNTTTNSTTQSHLISSFVHKLLWHFLKGLDIYHTDHNHR